MKMARKPSVKTIEKNIDALEGLMKKSLKRQTQDGLALVFNKLSCKGVANEIKQGRKVTGNAEFGIRMCVHGKLGPRVNVETLKFFPMTKKGKKIEDGFVKYVNLLLKNGGFREMDPGLIPSMRKRDEAFRKRIAKERREKRKK